MEHRVYAGLRLSGRATWSGPDIPAEQFLEGPLMVFSLGANYVLFPTVQVNALVGYISSRMPERARHWDSAGYWTRVGTNVALPWGFTVGAERRVPVDGLRGRVVQPFIPDNSARSRTKPASWGPRS